MHFKRYRIVAFCLVSLVMACSKSPSDNAVPTCDANISYSKTVKPIFTANCNMPGCHDDITITSLADYQTIHDGALQIKNSIISGRMPKNKVLAATDKNAIICWIDSGFKNN